MAAWLRFLAVLLLGIACLPATARETAPGIVRAADLPPEARQTLSLIKRGGPFPYAKDGSIFGNFERRLPPRPRGHYHEYTVRTPGSRDRGPRRIVAAGEPPGSEAFYYSEDHYQTFRRILE